MTSVASVKERLKRVLQPARQCRNCLPYMALKGPFNGKISVPDFPAARGMLGGVTF